MSATIIEGERQPLLNGQQSRPPAAVVAGNSNGVYDEENPNPDLVSEEIQPSWGPWRITKYVFWTLLISFGLGLFIKGFIDADDVDVSDPEIWLNFRKY